MSAFRLKPRHLLSASFAIVTIAIACGGGDDEATAPLATSVSAPTAAPAPPAPLPPLPASYPTSAAPVLAR